PGETVPVARIYRGGRFEPTCDSKNGDATRPWAYVGGRTFAASRATREGDLLRIVFAEADATATYRVIARPEYVAFELLEVAGAPVDRIDLLCLQLAGLPHRGAWVNFAFDEQFGVCLCGGNVRTNAEMDQAADHVVLRAAAERAVGLEGTVAVLFGCADPRNRFLGAMAVVERDFNMPAGAANRRHPDQRLSYLWASRPTPENIGEYIQLAKRGGFRMILFSYTSFATSAGHFTWNDAYPNGMADLKKVTDAIRNAGLKVGLHIHYSKASRNDPYVTPIPDDRLHQVRRFTLSEDVDAKADTIPVAENPAGCTLDDQRRILKLGAELVAYENYRTEPPFALTGCERGHLGTTASEHKRGDRVGLLNVDTWPRFIRFDQNTDIQDEVAHRIGDIYRQTGPYERVYFDGAEDVHAPFWYHVAAAQQRVFRCLDPPPAVCEAALYWHFSWHMITRSNAYDVVAPADGMKDFCRLMPCPTAEERVKDFSRIDFGWLGRFGGKNPAGPDVWEYVASRAAAWDCPISLHVSLADAESNPRAHDCLDAIRVWEGARLGNHLTDAQRQLLRIVRPEDAHYVPCFDQRGIWENIQANQGLTETQQRILANRQEHHLFQNEHGQYELAPIEEAPMGKVPVKAYLFQRASHPKDTCVLLWAIGDDVSLHLPIAGDSVRAMRPFGAAAPMERTGNELILPVGNRTYLCLPNTTPEQALSLLSASRAP
ncbi:MAG: hypothetical protein U1E05_21655, partial [Patescibacteria group bacterium]|nr:hypothetical protein [Patescibacteria group bacterium]